MKNQKDMRVLEKRRHLSTLLRKLADLVDHSTEAELSQLQHGDAQLSITRVRSQSKPRTSKDQTSLTKLDLETIARKLIDCGTRDQGMGLLRLEVNTRLSVETLARFLDLPVHRSDTLEILQERIVESVIGSRLRSEAVQGKYSQ